MTHREFTLALEGYAMSQGKDLYGEEKISHNKMMEMFARKRLRDRKRAQNGSC